MLRFHLDEHIDHAIARGLRDRGIDVTTTTDAGLLSAPDEEHLEHARRETRVIVRRDADFLRLAGQSQNHPGIVYCAPGQQTIGQIVRHLCLMSDCLDSKDTAGAVEYV